MPYLSSKGIRVGDATSYRTSALKVIRGLKHSISASVGFSKSFRTDDETRGLKISQIQWVSVLSCFVVSHPDRWVQSRQTLLNGDINRNYIHAMDMSSCALW